MTRPNLDLLQGTLDVLILKTLVPGAMHGWGIAQRIQQVSQEVLRVNQGSLYPALHRLIKRGWIDFAEGTSENNRRAKFYRLTPAGRRQLRAEISRWETLARAIARILRPAGQE
jgi:PadR family transcriptional regulator PadR